MGEQAQMKAINVIVPNRDQLHGQPIQSPHESSSEAFKNHLVTSSKSPVEHSPPRHDALSDINASLKKTWISSSPTSTLQISSSISSSKISDSGTPTVMPVGLSPASSSKSSPVATPHSPFTRALHLSAGPPSPKSKPMQRSDSRSSLDGNQRLLPPSPPTLTSSNPLIQKFVKNAIPASPRLSATRTGAIDIPGLIHSRRPDGLAEDEFDSKLVIVMVGLPARGKSFLVRKLMRYLSWLQYETKVFNVGNRRREVSHALQSNAPVHGQDATFFDANNFTARKLRDQLAMESLEELIDWLKSGGRVAIHDATNSTRERRRMILHRLSREPNVKTLFIESLCTDQEVLESNMRLKLSGPDYKDMDPEEALADFKARVKNYEKAYETISDEEEQELDLQYIKLINVGKKVVANNIHGYVAGQVVFYFLNFNLAEREIYITRHGESVDNVSRRLGGESGLSMAGRQYAKCLAKFMDDQVTKFHSEQVQDYHRRLVITSPPGSGVNTPTECEPEEKSLSVWTSMMRRTQETVDEMESSKYDIKHMRFLDEINAGTLAGMTFADIQKEYPAEWSALQEKKLGYRYPGPGGESLFDVIHRVNPVITEVERLQDHVLIVSHQAVIKVLLAYFLDLDMNKMTTLEVPLHTLFKLKPRPYGTEFQRFTYDPHSHRFMESPISLFATGKPHESVVATPSGTLEHSN